MRLIDENTFIDDTLVTCFEYQQFIDSMREQDKHYQPDHWTSYQYPAGQAKEPILGVRFSDAVGFCNWLTGRDDEYWKFRLPSLEEALTYKANSIAQNKPIGYWVNIPDDGHKISWLDPVPNNSRSLDYSDVIKLISPDTRKHIERMVRTINLDEKVERVVNKASNHAFDLDNMRTFIEYLAEFISETNHEVSDLSADHDLFSTIGGIRSRALSVTRKYNTLTNLVSVLDEVQSGTINLVQDRIGQKKLVSVRELIKLLVQFISLTRYHDRTLNGYFEILVEVFTLQERIAGRSPAFEGIRIVKERKT